MSDRVYLFKETQEYIEQQVWAKRDVNFIREKLEAVVDRIRDDKDKGVGFCDNIKAKRDGAVTEVEKSGFGIKAAAHEFTTQAGETKQANSYTVTFIPREFVGIQIVFYPKVRQNKITFGEARCYQKAEDGKTNEEVAKGIDEIIGVFRAQDAEVTKNICATLEYFKDLENIKEEPLPRGRAAGERKAFFVAKSVADVLENADSGQYSEEYITRLKDAVAKLTPLAEAMAKAIDDKGAWLKVEKESQSVDANGQKQKYTADASLRIVFEPRMKAEKNAEGEIVKIKRNSDGKMVAKMVAVKDENGKQVYDAAIDVPGTGLRFDVDITGDAAKVKGVIQDIWAGNALDRRVGFKEVNGKGTDEVKAFLAAVDTVTGREMPNSPLYDLYVRIRDEVNQKSADALDEQGNVRYGKDGKTPLKSEYVGWKPQYENPNTGKITPGHPQINIGNGANALIEITADADYPDILHATYVEFRGNGEAPYRTALTSKAQTMQLLGEIPYLQEILAREVPGCMEERNNRPQSGEGMEAEEEMPFR